MTLEKLLNHIGKNQKIIVFAYGEYDENKTPIENWIYTTVRKEEFQKLREKEIDIISAHFSYENTVIIWMAE